MKIIIPYSSKLSMSFSDDKTKENIVKSLGALSEKKDKSSKVIISEDDTYEDIMYKIGDTHQNFKYNPITKNTVLGILARLMGETRYLNIALQDPDHPINSIIDKITFEMKNRNMFNEILRIETPAKFVQNNGGGFISKENSKKILLNKNKISEVIYSVMNIDNLEDLEKFITFIETAQSIEELSDYLNQNNLTYKGSFEIFMFSKEYEKNVSYFSAIDSYFRKTIVDESKPDKEISEETEESKKYVSILKKMGEVNYGDENYYFNSKFINMAGILCYTITNFLIRIGKKDLINNVLIDPKKENIKGIAPNSGGITLREIYAAFSPKKISFNSPYFINAKFFDKKANQQINASAFNIGAGKEDGVLEINIDISEDEAIELKRRIQCVAVSSFQLGKKGLAYVKEIKIDE